MSRKVCKEFPYLGRISLPAWTEEESAEPRSRNVFLCLDSDAIGFDLYHQS